MHRVIVEPRTLENRKRVYDSKAIDDAWTRANANRIGDDEPLVIDLSSTTFLEHEALLFLVGVISERNGRGLQTLFDLPSVDKVIEFLSAWKFPQAIERVTNRSFESSLTERSLARYKKATAVPSRYLTMVSTPSGGREELLPRSFFALTPIILGDNPTRAATIASAPWLNRHIVSVLDRYLEGFGSRVATEVIREAVLNAASHPHAAVGYTSAQVIRLSTTPSESSSGPDALQISVWDDGRSFADTLENTLNSARSIKSPAFGIVVEHFRVSILENGVRSRVIHLDSDASEIANDPEVLVVSSFMLGITSVPSARDDRTNEDEDAHRYVPDEILPADAKPHGGLGLYLVRKMVIDQFRGTISYISGGHRLHLGPGVGPGDYIGVIHRLGDHDCRLKGNLLIATVPLRVP